MPAELATPRAGGAGTATTAAENTESGASTACVQCRQRHVKCDGKRPCKRCVDSDSTCVFVPSRRGQRYPTNRASLHTPPQEADASPGIKRTQNDAGLVPSDCPSKFLFRSITPPDLRSVVAWSKPAFRPASTGPPPRLRPHPAVGFERCISSYYYNFHASHPLVLPQTNLRPLVKEEALQPLLAVMQWVGSKYIAPELEQGPLLDVAKSSVDEAEAKSANGFTVQAMIVLMVALDGAGYQQQAIDLLGRAKRMLLSLGMNHNQFLIESKTRSGCLDESWRRTWWELYVLDAMFAGAHRATNFSLFDVPTDVGLPCEEDEYATNQIPEPRTVQDLNDRDFAMDSYPFSSFTYRILSAQNLGKVMRHFEAAEVDDNVHAQLEMLLTSWRHNLPASKQDSLQRDGRPDEVMFQAHMLNHTTSIFLHRSRAQLDLAPTRTIDACAPPPDEEEEDGGRAGAAAAAAAAAVNLHTRHVLSAANEIGKLATHRTPLVRHTHFFICAVVLASIVQLSAWSSSSSSSEGGGEEEQEESMVREQVRLCIGTLRQMATVWGTASRALGQVREVAGLVHGWRAQSRQMEQFLVHVTEEDMLNIFAEDTATTTLADMETTV
ncbi:hypothetical protein LMH87_003167 [Akanthomyces muscarius]|uniref:Zn(2)-C6 fungal-type domain-containing protein n=1 Tax=Akanthomyces muscarius TaxID=2231603 RepID=A0A9W8Q3V6_AKAMU|nr:hypothetical protein LMH87_003167 [Akanthomyces muscarius]KAJ4144277.1 hypothetical protein LMH87_003167 [Akanthomyces muscarius]